MNGEHEDSSPKKAKSDDASISPATSNSAAASTSNSDTKQKQFQLNFPLVNEKGEDLNWNGLSSYWNA